MKFKRNSETGVRENIQTLAEAVDCGNWVVVRDLLCDEDVDVDVDVADVEQCLLFHKLASASNISLSLVEDIVDEMLSRDVDINMADNNGDTAVMAAARCENWKVVWLLMSREGALPDKDRVIAFLRILSRSEYMNKNCGLSVNILGCLRDSLQQTIPECHHRAIHNVLFHVAAKVNVWSLVRELLTSDVELNILDEDGIGVMHRLAKGGMNHHFYLLQKVLDNGGDINLRNKDGDTATHVAVKNKNWKMVETLLRRGARVDIVNKDNHTVLHVLALYLQSTTATTVNAIFSILQKCCLTVDAREREGNTALQLAVKERNNLVTEKLLTLGARADALDANGRTILHTMAKDGNTYLLQKAVELDADLETEDSEGNTAIQVAAKLGNWSYVSNLLTNGAEVDTPDSEGFTVYDRILLSKSAQNYLQSMSKELVTRFPLSISLHWAIGLRCWKLAEDLVKDGAKVNRPDGKGFTVLQRLAQSDNAPDTLFGFMINRGADITVLTPDGDNLLQLAVKHKNWRIVERLLQYFTIRKPDSEGYYFLQRLVEYRGDLMPLSFRVLLNKGAITWFRTPSGDTLLHLAAKHGNISMVQYLVKEGAEANINQLNSEGLSVIHRLVQCEDEKSEYVIVSIVDLLVGKGADPRLRNLSGDTSLHLAARLNKWKLCECLIKNGCGIDEPDSEGFYIMHRFAQNKLLCQKPRGKSNKQFEDFCLLLFSKGADVSVHNSAGNSVIHLAARNGNWKLVDLLVEKGCDVNELDSEGLNVLHRLAQESHLKEADSHFRTLLNKGADVCVQCSTGDSAIHLAAKNNNWKLVQLLAEHGCDINKVDSEGLNIIHRLVQTTQVSHVSYYTDTVSLDSTFRTLVNKGADVSVRCSSGDTILHLAARHNKWNIVEFLVEQGFEVNQPDSEGFYILHRYVQRDLLKSTSCKLNETSMDPFLCSLLDKGACPFVCSPNGDSVFHLAARHDHLEIIQQILARGTKITINVDESDSEGFTILHRLAMTRNISKSSISILRFLLENGANCNTLCPTGDSAMHLAVKHSNWYIIEELLRNKIDTQSVAAVTNTQSDIRINVRESAEKCDRKRTHSSKASRKQIGKVPFIIDAKDSCGNTILHHSAKARKWNQVHKLLTCGADTTLTDDEGHTILYWLATVESATFNDYREMLSVLNIMRGRVVNIAERDEFGDTLIQTAARNRNVEVVDLLLDHLDDVNIRDSDGLTILHRVVQCLSPESLNIVKNLMKRKADTEIPDPQGDTAIHLAAYCKNWDVVYELLDHVRDVNSTDSKGLTILHRAAKCMQSISLKLLEILMKRNADKKIPDPTGDTALHLAAQCENWDIVRELIRNRAWAGNPDSQGKSVLHRLARCNSCLKPEKLSLVQLLVSSGVDLNTKDRQGLTAIQLALIDKEWEVIQLLLEGGADVDLNVPSKGKSFFHELAVSTIEDAQTARSVTQQLKRRGLNLDQRCSPPRFPGYRFSLLIYELHEETPLNLAASHSNWTVVQVFLEHGADASIPDREGWYVCHRLAMCNRNSNLSGVILSSLLLLLTRNGFEMNKTGPDGRSSVQLSMNCKNWELFWLLVDSGISFSLNEKKTILENSFLFPKYKTDEDKLRKLMLHFTEKENFNCEVDPKEALKKCFLHCNWLVAKTLVECGVDINRDIGSRTLMHFLISKYRRREQEMWLTLLDTLLARGADINSRDRHGRTILFKNWRTLSLNYSQEASGSLLCALLNRGASPFLFDFEGLSLLAYVMDYGESVALQYLKPLIQLGVCTHLLTEAASVYFQWAFHIENVRAFEMLVESGPSSNREIFELNTRYQVELSSRDKTTAKRQMLDILNHAASQPRSLKSLCRLTVSHALGCGPHRMDRAKSLPLPPLVKNYLLFHDLFSTESLSPSEKASPSDYSDYEESEYIYDPHRHSSDSDDFEDREDRLRSSTFRYLTRTNSRRTANSKASF